MSTAAVFKRVAVTLGADLVVFWRVLVVVVTPIVCLPLPLCRRSSVRIKACPLTCAPVEMNFLLRFKRFVSYY